MGRAQAHGAGAKPITTCIVVCRDGFRCALPILRFFFITFVNTIFTTLVTPRFTAFSESNARIKAPLACALAASPINRAATLIAY
jgi:hypothetical protein